ncbi:hypothetical protein K440DRAFT_621039 [Wilcoxina mikolae CBS 423.85]|nr:hypothetical protein K440DRAFT_621039 [Wilcoxina mikolae CBS 423.85]
MTSSKRNVGARSSLATTTPPPTGAPLPAVSTIHAAGESTQSRPSTPARKTSTTSLATAAARSTPSATASQLGRQDRSTTSNDADDCSKRTSWFGKKGTWPRSGQKSAPVIQVAQEHVARESTNSPAVEEPTATNTLAVLPDRLPSDKKSNTKLNEEYTQRNASTTSFSKPSLMNPARPMVAPPQETPAPESRSHSPAPEPESDPEPESESEPEPEPETEPAPVDPPKGDVIAPAQPNPSTVQGISSWIPLSGWWYGTPVTPAAPEPEDAKEPTKEPAKEPAEEPVVKEPVVKEPVVEEPVAEVPTIQEPVKEPEAQPPPEEPKHENTVGSVVGIDGSADSIRSTRPRSWFGFWGGDPEATPVTTLDVKIADETLLEVPKPQPRAPTPPIPIAEPAPTPVSTANASPQPEPVTASNTPPNRGYGWAFWYSGKTADVNTTTSTEGELAVAGAPSESNPQKAKVKQPEMPPTPSKSSSAVSLLQEDPRPETPRSSKSKSTTSKAAPAKPPKAETNGTAFPALLPSSASIVAAAETSAAMVAAAETSAAKKKLQKMMLPQNHLLPAFETCYRRPDQPSMLQQFTKIFRHTPLSTSHLYVAKQTPRIKKAVAIGVHGFFPMRLVRTVLGEPTGTSIRFANHAASSIKRWAEKNGVEVEVEKIALEGEGKVADRVEMLWKLLQNWMDHVRSADFVLMAAHSQGVVVGMQLLARLIEEGCVDNARIGFTAMAGINLGPFGHLPTTLLTGSARELFEFQKQESTVSKKYIQALRTVLAHNVRILYVGSIDDQLVPLESSTMTNISHPYIYRAVFVDGRVHAPDFLSHLVGFAMKLRNLGVSDHGLVRELSTPLAGSLYGGEGHSRIYNDGAVYDLGVRHALETTECTGVPLRVSSFEIPTNGNPYFLPWSLRGMLEETIVRTQLAAECEQLLEQFENWKPTSKTLKDVKFRLEGIRSKL